MSAADKEELERLCDGLHEAINHGDAKTPMLALIDFMQLHGSSLWLTWEERDDAWECAWSMGDPHFTGIGSTMEFAIWECAVRAL